MSIKLHLLKNKTHNVGTLSIFTMTRKGKKETRRDEMKNLENVPMLFFIQPRAGTYSISSMDLLREETMAFRKKNLNPAFDKIVF